MFSERVGAALTPFPRIKNLVKRLQIQLQWIRWRLDRRSYPAGPIRRLHLGCGSIDYPGFINVDTRLAKHVHHVQGIEDLSRFPDGSIDFIYSSHCLEHVSHAKVANVLKEWCRVLRAGGRLRLSVPDFDHLVNLYLESGRDINSILLPLMGGQDYAYNFHYTAFTHRELSALMRAAGFTAVQSWTPGCDEFGSIPDWSDKLITYRDKHYPVSLNLQATKSEHQYSEDAPLIKS